ncbi:MAG: hemerythrin domain-containing protein [Cyclobacteriaceae bacterium]
MVEWDTKYATGVKEVDDQHQALFNYINDLEECIEESAFEGNRIQIILNYFQMFCATHFCLEETCMLLRKCAVHDKNKRAHEQFIAYYKKFRAGYNLSGNKRKLLTDFHEKMIKWLSNHIMKIDMSLKYS